MAREANNDFRMKLLTGPDENSDLSKDEDHKTKLFTKQSEDADPLEEGGEGRKATLSEREAVSCNDLSKDEDHKTKLSTKQSKDADLLEEEDEEGKATL